MLKRKLQCTQHPTPNTQHPKVKYTSGVKIFVSLLILILTANVAALLYITVGY